MEKTAKIDLQRLQLLNDRICQTIDELNQLRMTAQVQTPYGYVPAPFTSIPQMYGYGQGFSQPALNQFGSFIPSYPVQSVNPWSSVSPLGFRNVGYTNGHYPQGTEFGDHRFSQPAYGHAPISPVVQAW